MEHMIFKLYFCISGLASRYMFVTISGERNNTSNRQGRPLLLFLSPLRILRFKKIMTSISLLIAKIKIK